MVGFAIKIDVDKKEYHKAVSVLSKIANFADPFGQISDPKKRPMSRVKRYMYASTMSKFTAEGIDEKGGRKWWKRWTPKYRKFRVNVMNQPSPILQLDGSYITKTGKIYTYNLQLIRSIKQAKRNPAGILLITDAIHAATHQYGDMKRAGSRSKVGLLKRAVRKYFGRRKYKLGPSLMGVMIKPFLKQRKRARNIPARPFFTFTLYDQSRIVDIHSTCLAQIMRMYGIHTARSLVGM